MSTCLSPPCTGEMTQETVTRTDGQCSVCGLDHRRPDADTEWNEIVGPVYVTFSGGTVLSGAGETSTAPGNVGTFLVDGVKFDGPTVPTPTPTAKATRSFTKTSSSRYSRPPEIGTRGETA